MSSESKTTPLKVGHWHFAHSFVRGNWRNEDESTFSLLAKCCHDIDLLVYWMGEKKRCVRVSSFGALAHFRKENAPKNSASNCFRCPVEADCCYSTKKIYFRPNMNPNGWPYSVVLNTDGPLVLNPNSKEDIEDLLQNTNDCEKVEILKKALQHPESQYGRCVYQCDNDVCDNQTVILNFDDSSIATLTMIAFSESQCQRKTVIYGTKGQLEWDDSKSTTEINHFDFLTLKKQILDGKLIDTNDETETNEQFRKLKGHGGTDYILIDSFVNAILHNNKSYILTDVKESLKSHLVVFAAELSRRKSKVININEDGSFTY
jgi:predicted dehydrogenase